MSSFPGPDPDAPVIPPKRTSGGSNGFTPHMTNGNMENHKIFKEASRFDCYHGKLESKQVEKILRSHLQIKGSYLLRKSNRHSDALTFSVVHTANHIYHFNVFWSRGKFTVTEALTFSSLGKLIAYFEKNEIPGDGTPGLYLQHPIASAKPLTLNNLAPAASLTPAASSSPISYRKSPKSASPNTTPPASPRYRGPGFFGKTPPSSPKLVHRKQPSFELSRSVDQESRQNANAAASPPFDPADRPPMPIPREPIYDSARHTYGIYSVPDDPDRDRFYDIRALCRKADVEIAKASKKCTCGLYLDESTLVDAWMMHRDIENTATKGKIFFVNTANNEATWQLPNQIRKKMETVDPDKWKRINALLQSEGAKT